MNDIFWMTQALQLAKLAAKQAEVPVGALLVLNHEVIGEGFNRPISECDPTAHAEMIALRQGAARLNNYRLLNTTLYVTLEPCSMCMGALIHARVNRVVFGAHDYKSRESNHQVVYEGGLLGKECGEILIDFFKDKRK